MNIGALGVASRVLESRCFIISLLLWSLLDCSKKEMVGNKGRKRERWGITYKTGPKLDVNWGCCRLIYFNYLTI